MDDWGESTAPSEQTDFYNDDGGGRSYGKGRGFVAHSDDKDAGGYGDYNDNDDFGGGGRPGRGGGRGGGRGNRGRGGGRGGYRNRQEDGDSYKTGNDYGYENDDNGDNGGGGFRPSNGGRDGNFRNKNYDDQNDDGENGGFGSRGRGGRGGRGRGRSDRGDNFGRNGGYGDDNESHDERGDRGRGRREGNDDNEESEKPKEIYIPADFPTDEKSVFETGVSQGINFDKYDKIEVKVTGENPPQPIQQFEQAGLRNIVLENIMKSEYTKPTPVQKYALPIIMGGRDLMACAQTGSGKTAAFAVPIIHTLLDKPTDLVMTSGGCEPQVIIVSPTRELTIQIYRQIVKFALNSILKTVVAYGGTSVMHQGGKLEAGCHILVATPGRLMDFVERGRVKFSSVRFLVLDEADRMLDMGFLPSIEKMVDHETMVPLQERQTLMFSATFPDDVQRLAARFLNNYIFLAVGIVGGACSDVEQNFYEVAKYKKKDMLKEILERENDKGTLSGTLVFVEMKKKADFIAVFLSENNYPTTSIHGDRLQRQREEALADFKSGKMSILVATAVAARGLDIKNVSHVINFDMPKGIDEYVHRIGRTGRVGNKGRATSFFEPTDDIPLREDLVKILKQANQPVPDWLEAGGVTRSYAPGRGKQYGGEDVRDFNDGGDIYAEAASTQSPIDAEPDEAW